MQYLPGYLEQIDLVSPGDQVGEANAYEADQLAALIEVMEDGFYFFQKDIVRIGIRDAPLFGIDLKIGVADLYGDAAGKFILGAEFVRN